MHVVQDEHKETIAVSVTEANGGEVRYPKKIANMPEAVEKLVRQRSSPANRLSCGSVTDR